MSFIRFIIACALCFSFQAFAIENTATTTTEEISHAVAGKQVNLNSATAEQLKAIKGIGAAKAKAIVEYRTAHGPFKSVNDLTEVKGFSHKVVEKLTQKNPGVMVVE